MGFYLAIIGSLIAYFAVPILCCRIIRLQNSQFPTLLTFTFSFTLQQILFAFFASLGCSYSLSFIFGAFFVFWATRSVSLDSSLIEKTERPSTLSFSQIVPWILLATVLLLCLWIRSHYPFVNFLNNGDDVGVEKLFNLSMQQSFLYGKSYPPEWVWLSGEPIRYYAFLKSFPGVWSFLARAWFGNADTGGFFFLFSESFYTALYASLIAAWIIWFGRFAKEQFTIRCIAIFTASITVVGTHFQAFWMGIKGFFTGDEVNWWTLSSQVIPYTDNQYPAWLLMIGDNHAYFQAYFLQVLFWGAFLSLVLYERITIIGSSIVGALLAALLISHPGSLLVNLCSIGGFVILYLGWIVSCREFQLLKRLFSNASYASLVAIVFAGQLYLPSGEVKFVVPSREIVSKLLPFLNLNLSVLVVFCLALTLVLLEKGRVKTLVQKIKAAEWIWVLTFILAALSVIYGRPALMVMILCASTLFMTFSSDGYDPKDRQSVLSLFAATSFFIWLMPEVIAFDHKMDSRVEWIRFQMSLRFWPEGYILIPFAVALSVSTLLGQRKIKIFSLLIGALVICSFFISHAPGFQNRSIRARQTQTLNGFSEFNLRYPADSYLANFLRNLPYDQQLVIGEACGLGMQEVPVDFGWSGRIAAFSGRIGICGWARHAMLYNSPLQQAGFKGLRVENKLGGYLQAFKGFMEAVLAKNSLLININRQALTSYGVTHLVFGEKEKMLFPLLNIDEIGKSIGVQPLLRLNNGMGIIIIK
jgi:hypothetical protein